MILKVKVKFTPVTGHKGLEVDRGVAYSFFNLSTKWGWVVSAMPWLLYTLEKTQYPLYRSLGGPQGQSGCVQNILPRMGFDLWTIQPIANRYIDCTIPAHNNDFSNMIT
jgi:hypothetical protein